MKNAIRTLGIMLGFGLLGLGFIAGAWGAEYGPRMLFKSRATVSGEWLRIGDVADVKGQRNALVEEIRRLPIKEAPAPGEATVVTRREIEAALEAVPEEIRRAWEPAPLEITVVREGRLLEAEEIGRIIEGHIRKTCPGEIFRWRSGKCGTSRKSPCRRKPGPARFGFRNLCAKADGFEPT